MSLQENEFRFNLTFESFAHISPLIVRDKLVVHFKNTSEPFFVCDKIEKPIVGRYRTISENIRP